jgi:hypothetical protein
MFSPLRLILGVTVTALAALVGLLAEKECLFYSAASTTYVLGWLAVSMRG